MNFDGFSEYAGKSLIILATLEALGAVMAVLFCMTLAALVIYLIGVWRLCRKEVLIRSISERGLP